METLVQTQQPMSATEPPQSSEKLDACSQPLAAGSKAHQFYKCLLNEHAQKLRKPAPVYRTHNEGSDHPPKFRSTVWIDGVSYTSPNTFQQRKMAEMDACRVAYCAIIQKSKDEALRFIQEDKHFCKSILAEYADKMGIEKPNYETMQQGTMVVFRSSLVFNGVSYSGDIARSKKEAEQLAARAAILKYLESESANDMSEIIQFKFRLSVASLSSGAFVGTQTGGDNNNVSNEAILDSGNSTMPKSSAVLESCLLQGTTVPATSLTPVITQQPISMVSVEAVTPATSVVTQPPVANVSTETVTPATSVVTQPPVASVPIETITPSTSVVTQPPVANVPIETVTPVTSVVTQPPVANVPIKTVTPVVPIVTQSPLSNVSFDAITSAVPAPVNLTQIPSAEINNSSTPSIVPAPCLGQLGNVPEARIFSDVRQPGNSHASPMTIVPPLPLAPQAPEHMPVMDQTAGQTSDRKRNRKNRKKAQKKMRAQMEMSAMPMGQVPPCSSA